MGASTMDELIRLHGRLTVTTFEADDPLQGPVESVSVENILCYAGLSVMINAMNWSGVQDQNATMGSPFAAVFMYPIYGAIGTALPVVAATDTVLGAEAARSVVSAAGTTGATAANNAIVTWSFLFPIPGSSIVISEAGVFLNATSILNTGSLFDHALISPTVTQTNTQMATLQAAFSWGS